MVRIHLNDANFVNGEAKAMIYEQHDEHVWAWRQYRACLFGLHAFVISYNLERLGPVFEDILGENLWDLYAR